MVNEFAKRTYPVRHDDSWCWSLDCVKPSCDSGIIDCLALDLLIAAMRCHDDEWTSNCTCKFMFKTATTIV